MPSAKSFLFMCGQQKAAYYPLPISKFAVSSISEDTASSGHGETGLWVTIQCEVFF